MSASQSISCCSLVNPVILGSLRCSLGFFTFGLCSSWLLDFLLSGSGTLALLLFLVSILVLGGGITCISLAFLFVLLYGGASATLALLLWHASASHSFDVRLLRRVIVINLIVVAGGLLDLILLRLVLIDTRTEVVRVSPERDVQHLQEGVHTGDQALRLGAVGLDGGCSTEDDNLISQVGCHDEIVLNDEGCTLGIHDPALHDARGENTLFRVQVRGRLIDQVEIARLGQGDNDGDTLQLTSRQVLNFVVEEGGDIEWDDDFRAEQR